MILIDANVWIYFLDAGLPEHSRVSQALPALLTDDDALIPATVQLEVLHYIARQMEDAATAAADFLATPGDVAAVTGAIAAEAAQVLLAHRDAGIGGRDAALLAIARRHEAGLVTADKALARVAKQLGIPVTNPLRGGP